jgi:leader peptidase (prepilin peptidase)/N-methyltransferase
MWILASFGVLVGLLAGCVVAMVSMRLPLSLQREWRADAHQYLDLPYTADLSIHSAPKWEFLKGWRFLAIEVVCAAIGAALFWRLGFSVEALVYAVLFWSLIAVAVIDHETMYIPDAIVQPLLWAGMLFYAFTAPDQLQWHVLGAAAGYCALRWLPVGQGDAKLCAVAGAWVGLESLLMFFTIGAVLGVVVGLAYYRLRGKSEPCPYGPSLVVGLLSTLAMQLNNYSIINPLDFFL